MSYIIIENIKYVNVCRGRSNHLGHRAHVLMCIYQPAGSLYSIIKILHKMGTSLQIPVFLDISI